MDEKRFAKMTNQVIKEAGLHTAEMDDEALSYVDQSFDVILSALKVIDDNLKKIKTNTIPEKAAVDAIDDLLETAVKPYLADVLKAFQNLGN